MNLNNYGWNNFFEKSLGNTKLLPGRVIAYYGKYYRVVTEQGDLLCELTGKYKFSTLENGKLPAVGDFVLIDKLPNEDKGIIHDVLPRFSQFSRKVAGKEFAEQVLVANFDTVFIFSALNNNYNLRRIERYLVMAWESGALPVIILSKSDLCLDVEEKLSEVRSIAPGVDIYAISSLQKIGLAEIHSYLKPSKTIALLGSSGVGKSTLINTLADREILKVNEVREQDDRGRHTTTHRELVMLPNGAMVIDTPGMRELALWEGDEGLSGTFSDIETLASSCKFTDCKHVNEPGCAVLSAIEEGILDRKRYESYLRLEKEAKYIESKANQRLRIEQKKRSKEIAKYIRIKKNNPIE